MIHSDIMIQDIWQKTEEWLTQKALPLWAQEGYDKEENSFEERLDLDGKKIDDYPRRLMVQARQIYAFTQAAKHEWFKGAEKLVVDTAESMIEKYYKADGKDGWVFSVFPDGEVENNTRDLYAHAFALLGLACAFRISRNDKYLKLADKTLAFLDKEMADGNGGYYTELGRTEDRNQNPHMHLFEALLELYDVHRMRDYGVRAKALFQFLSPKIFKETPSVVVELFDENWQQLETPEGKIVMPGHNYEWIWLIHRYEDLLGEKVEASISKNLFKNAFNTGTGSDFRIYIEMQENGEIQKNIYRLWPHCEAIRACAIQTDENKKQFADTWMKSMYESFFEKAPEGGWIDRITTFGAPEVECIPASSFYHIVGALAAYKQYM